MANQEDENVPPGYTVIYCRFITRNGKRIFPPAGKKAWRLLVKIRKQW